MSTDQAYGFFREVFLDKTLQGQLHHALAAASPEIVSQIARARGYQVDPEDVGKALGGPLADGDKVGNGFAEDEPGTGKLDRIVEHVMARDFWEHFRQSDIWKRIEVQSGWDPFREAAPFRMTIPGPSWVQVMGGRNESGIEEEGRPSAVDLYDSL
ncbi:Nif11-like leader peptide family natural product precursor [Novosphingobium lindaniclasticum]